MSVYVGTLLLFVIYFAAQVTNSMNARAGQLAGLYPAMVLYLGSGCLCVLLWLLLVGKPLQLAALLACPWYIYANAVGNVAVVGAILFLIPRMGVGIFFATVTVGQFFAALGVDHLGLAGPVQSITTLRIVAVLSISIGAFIFTFLNNPGHHAKTTPTNVQPMLLLVGVAVGAAQTTMDAINTKAGALLGTETAVLLYLGLGSIAATLVALWQGPRKLLAITRLGPVYWIPGIVNVLMVGLPVLLIPMVGIGLYTGVRFLASTTASVVFDTIGLMQMPRIPMGAGRIVGSVFMLAGVLLLT